MKLWAYKNFVPFFGPPCTCLTKKTFHTEKNSECRVHTKTTFIIDYS